MEESELREAVSSAIKLINKDFGELDKQFEGYTPVYAFNTEDAVSVFNRYSKYITDQSVLCVTGSGDNILELLALGARKIVSFDINKHAKYYACLKLAFVKSGLSYEEFLRFFFGKCGDTILDYETYKKIEDYIPNIAKSYWHQVFEYINASGIILKNNESNLIMTQYGFLSFPSLNATIGNENSYANLKRYNELAQLIKDMDIDDKIEFIDSALFEIDKVLDENFSFMYLSNIMDFTSEFIDAEDLEDRLKIFKEYITNVLSNYSLDAGLILVGFISSAHSNVFDTFYRYWEYRSIFPESECYFLDDLYPHNTRDHVIIFCNKENLREIKKLMYDSIDYY